MFTAKKNWKNILDLEWSFHTYLSEMLVFLFDFHNNDKMFEAHIFFIQKSTYQHSSEGESWVKPGSRVIPVTTLLSKLVTLVQNGGHSNN